MADRAKKWASKLSGDNRKYLYDSQKERMVELEKKASDDLEKIEIQIKSMAQGYPALHLPYYIIFAKEIYRLRNKFKSQTLINEMEILQGKWQRRGLDINLLNQIKKFYVPAYVIPVYFRLDISLLDGPDVLA